MKSSLLFNYLLVCLMMVHPLLGATIFDQLQVIVEVIMWILLGYGIVKMKLHQSDIILLIIYLVVSAGSLVINDLHSSLLNFKIYGLFVFTLIYFRKIDFFPSGLLFGFLLVNIAYAIGAKVFNLWILESAWFFDKQAAYLYSRPIGFIGSPHSTSTFLAIFYLYLVQTKKLRVMQLIILFGLFLYSSWTVVIAVAISLIYIWISRIIKFAINPFLFLAIGLVTLFLTMEVVLSLAGEVEGSRYFTLEIMTAMIFDAEFYRGIFGFFPRGHDLFVLQQQKTFADVGNELGFVKILVEGGFVLAFASFYLIIKRTKWFTIFFLITLFHYSYFINIPFILYVAMMFNKQIDSYLGNMNREPKLEPVVANR